MPEPTSFYETLLGRVEGGGASGGRPPRASASIVLWRREGGAIEVYWVRRSPQLRFMGGWHAFPGGGISRSDAAIAVDGRPSGLPSAGASSTAPHPGLSDAEFERLGPDLAPGLLAGALRELFEETGILPVSEILRGTTAERLAQLDAARRRLLEQEVEFAEILETLELQLSADLLSFAGRWLTPPLAPLRFDNRFFLLEWPRDRQLQPTILPGELVEGEWLHPAEALERWRSGEVITAPPILHLLRVLAEDGPDAGHRRLLDTREADLGSMRRVEFRPGVVMLPLLTPTLPPATHTNAYLLGRGELVLIDPATPYRDEQERLREAVDAVLAAGQTVREIWLTHHHPDHIGAVERMRRHLGVPVAAHPATAERLRGAIEIDRELADDERVELAGDPPFVVRVLHTPGHARGHLCFVDEAGGSVIAGDLVSGISTIVIDPPEGEMEAYLGSLERLAALEPKTLFPGHGPPLIDAAAKLRALREHRLWREDRIRDAWRAGHRSAEAMVAEVYDDVQPMLHPVATRQIEAHFERLRRRGEID